MVDEYVKGWCFGVSGDYIIYFIILFIFYNNYVYFYIYE